jgi:hypothetical protein
VAVLRKYFFIDESGDPDFYAAGGKLIVGSAGFQPLLLMGMIETEDRRALRKAMENLKKKIEGDPLFNKLHSVKPGWYLHAITDHPDIRTRVVDAIRSLDGFRTFVVIGRKKLLRFNMTHKNDPTEFYYDLLHHLLKQRMNDSDCFYQIYLAHRQKANMKKFETAIRRALERDNERRKKPRTIQYHCDIVMSAEYPEIGIVDYLLWSLQRYIIRKEDRFFDTLKGKYSLIIDLYDTAHYSAAGKKTTNYYTKENPFSIEKASIFEL